MELNRQPQALDTLATHVLQYARDNYEKNGWDIVVETMGNKDVQEVIKGAKTVRGAIYMMSRYIRPTANYRADIRGA